VAEGRNSGWWLAAALAAAFAILVGLRLHGFSLAAWHEVLDASPAPEVLLGAPRGLRTDDWWVHLPLALSQAHQDPAFPLVNRDVGLGQSALVPLSLPVAHPVTLLRPELWGFFLGDDVGLAWLWWARSLGLFGVWLAVFARLAPGRLGLAAAGAALLTASPFFQFWSLNAAPMAASMGLAVLASMALARARSVRSVAASAAALGAAGGCFALALYPPYQIVLAWLYLALMAGWLWAERAQLPRERVGARQLGLPAAALVPLAAGLAFAGAAGDAIEAMSQTAYPGVRVETGGERALYDLANASLGAPLLATEWEPLGNLCEAASFLWMGPVVAAFAAARRLLRREPLDPVLAAVAAYGAILGVYVVAGLPEAVARGTLLSRVPGPRAVLGLGVADAILLVRYLGRRVPARGAERGLALAVAAAFGIALAACALPLKRALPELPLAALLGAALANAALAYAVLAASRPALPAVALAVLSAASSLWFNPLAAGGSGYLAANPVAERILALDRGAGGRSRWVVFGGVEVANLFRALGVRCLNGTLPVPQPELWRPLDPSASGREIYNRYAWVAFAAAPPETPRFQKLADDAFAVFVNPGSAAFRSLGVTHVVVSGGDRALFERLSGFRSLGSVGRHHFYEATPP
jgi:hypothetical protein